MTKCSKLDFKCTFLSVVTTEVGGTFSALPHDDTPLTAPLQEGRGAAQTEQLQEGRGAAQTTELQEGRGAAQTTQLQEGRGTAQTTELQTTKLQKGRGAVHTTQFQEGGGAAQTNQLQVGRGAVQTTQLPEGNGVIQTASRLIRRRKMVSLNDNMSSCYKPDSSKKKRASQTTSTNFSLTAAWY